MTIHTFQSMKCDTTGTIPESDMCEYTNTVWNSTLSDCWVNLTFLALPAQQVQPNDPQQTDLDCLHAHSWCVFWHGAQNLTTQIYRIKSNRPAMIGQNDKILCHPRGQASLIWTTRVKLNWIGRYYFGIWENFHRNQSIISSICPGSSKKAKIRPSLTVQAVCSALFHFIYHLSTMLHP